MKLALIDDEGTVVDTIDGIEEYNLDESNPVARADLVNDIRAMVNKATVKPKGGPGTVLMIYQDPFTRQKEEGRARLYECLLVSPGEPYFEDWQVRFEGENEYHRRRIAFL